MGRYCTRLNLRWGPCTLTAPQSPAPTRLPRHRRSSTTTSASKDDPYTAPFSPLPSFSSPEPAKADTHAEPAPEAATSAVKRRTGAKRVRRLGARWSMVAERCTEMSRKR